MGSFRVISCRTNWIIKQWFELSLCFCRVTSVRMCASLSSHPSICADDEQGSICRETEIKYSQLRLYPCYFKEMVIWFILAALDWIWSHFFLPSTWDRRAQCAAAATAGEQDPPSPPFNDSIIWLPWTPPPVSSSLLFLLSQCWL